MKRRALSLAEVVMSVFLLSFVALAVSSMASMAFRAQRRNEHVLSATLAAQTVIAQIRVWAQNPDHYLSNWADYDNKSFAAPNLPDNTVKVRCLPKGRSLDSPCQALEAQWVSAPAGVRRMPRPVVPVEVTVAWSPARGDSVTLVAYIGEPKRDITNAQVQVVGPNPTSLANGQTASYSVTVNDAQNRPLDNLLFRWSVDARFVTVTGQRDGRKCTMIRDQAPRPSIPRPPSTLPVQCYTSYAGSPIRIIPKGIDMP